MTKIPCVIFAGGKSSRMGEDKALLPFSNFSTLSEFQLQRLEKIFLNVYISCKDSKKFPFNANFILDANDSSTYAPTAGFVASFKYLKEDSFFAISVDSPFISKEVIQKIIDADTVELDATIARTDKGMQPLCGIYHRTLASAFIQMQDNNTHKLGQLLKTSNTQYLNFEDSNIFLNLNEPQDYQKALRLVNTPLL
ncbi:MAG: molybdenum cofactor guanylyltransferase MobA [Sulfurimonas sp.]|nr:molybdenum cofactor guanylyltransferase MobA [Sulfurimonas sp.]